MDHVRYAELQKLVEETLLKVKPIERTLYEILGPVTRVVEVGPTESGIESLRKSFGLTK